MATAWGERPVPVVSGETAPFWEACKKGQFLIQKCESCGKFQYHYRGICCHCWSDRLVDVPIAGNGTVFTFTVVERNRMAGFAELTPYVVALVELPEGLKILSNIINCDPDEVEIGLPVRLIFVDGPDDLRIPMFEPNRA